MLRGGKCLIGAPVPPTPLQVAAVVAVALVATVAAASAAPASILPCPMLLTSSYTKDMEDSAPITITHRVSGDRSLLEVRELALGACTGTCTWGELWCTAPVI